MNMSEDLQIIQKPRVDLVIFLDLISFFLVKKVKFDYKYKKNKYIQKYIYYNYELFIMATLNQIK